MRLRNLSRATAVGFVAVGAMLSLSTSAYAADRTVNLPDGRGYFKHTDDGDKFTVCDTRADGAGVTGFLWRTVGGASTVVMTVNDGGDGGCDSKVYDVKGTTQYKMEICWPGTNDLVCRNSGYFSES
ncbi:hypothetical protein OG897_18610 [Streptomyces sp. NBC_00237]|uniref:hypothetical protein n=1 Tax=Streptomyces sp. NBC_00237 TaxID=2975687 RepID=UPI0022584E91|nr:hypothetical protein [Streptomyces sp. NBC_00237]MCX5203451.1 hypothetical protein [Streptomyces sp. NBC_00237]